MAMADDTKINAEGLRVGLAATEAAALRGEHDQHHWRCGTGMCFAGHYLTAVGQDNWVSDDPESPWFETLAELPGDPLGDVWTPNPKCGGVRWVAPGDRAGRLLGLGSRDEQDLFSCENSLEDLRRIVSHLTERADSGSEPS